MQHRPVRSFQLACWFGLLAGFGEVTLLGIKKFYFHDAVRFGMDVVWLAPIADTILFCGLGLLMLAAVRRWPKGLWPQAVVFVFTFLTLLSWLLMYKPLYLSARILLAAGIATQIANATTRWTGGFESLVRRSLPVMAAMVLVAAAGIVSIPKLARQRTLTQLPASHAGAPNVMLITLDTVRASNVSLYGYGRRTMPNLERWARRGVVFDRAVSAAPWTLTSHASMFTGRWPHELSASLQKPLDDAQPTLAEALQQNGYVTAGFVANTFYCGYEFGLGRGFLYYDDYSLSLRELLMSSTLAQNIANSSVVRRVLGYYDNIPRKNAETLTDDFLGWLPAAGGRPFFAFLNYFDAHEAYLPPPPFASAFAPPGPVTSHLLKQEARRSLRKDWTTRPQEEIRAELDMYDGAIAYLDAQLDRLFTELSSRGLLDNTIVIVTSDHGEQFGEHGLFLHGNSLYDALLHVPLVIMYPAKVPADRRVANQVSLRDIPATVMDLIAAAGGTRFPGRPLTRYWASGPAGGGDEPDWALSEVAHADFGNDSYPIAKGDMQSLVSGRYHYIRNGDGRAELYALDTDPGELQDLAADPAAKPVLERFRTELAAAAARGSR